jgi:hypothetical protein
MRRLNEPVAYRYEESPTNIPVSVIGCISRNIAVTTAGVFSPEPLRCAIDVMGLDRVLFSVDDPLADSDEAAGSSRRQATAVVPGSPRRPAIPRS